MRPLHVAIALLVLFCALAAGFLHANSQTFDEAAHLTAGYSYWAKGDFRLNPEHPPLAKELAALPLVAFYQLPFAPSAAQWEGADEWLIANDFVYGSPVSATTILTVARLPMVLLGALLVALIGWWAHRLWGGWAAVVAMALAALDPNFIANSCLVTTDVPAVLFTTLALYGLWEYWNAPSWRRLLAVAVAVALALVTKYSAVFLVGIVPVLMLSHRLWCGGPLLPPARSPVEKWLGAVAVVLLASLIIPAAYGGSGFSSWIEGLSSVLGHQQGGHPGFLLGRYSSDGWWYYFPLAFLMKTPLGSLVLICASLVLWRAGRPLDRRAALVLLGPVLLLVGVMMTGRINIGLRHILQIYPLLYVAAGRLATVTSRRKWLAPALITTALVASALSSLAVAPHQLAYFNEAAGGPRAGIRRLSDSNLDWGQDLRGLQHYLEAQGNPIIYLSYFGAAQPSYYGIRYLAVGPNPEHSIMQVPPDGPQLFAISAFNQQGVRAADNAVFRWLESRVPVAHVGWSIYVYDLTGDADGREKLRETIVRCHQPGSCGIPPFLGERRDQGRR